MGQLITILNDPVTLEDVEKIPRKDIVKFPDLSCIPPELALAILSHLNATDLCLAACVWQHLGNDEMLWQQQCRRMWQYCRAYKRWREPGFSFRRLYLTLDEASLTFGANAFEGIEYLKRYNLITDDSRDIAAFLHGARNLDKEQERCFLEQRPDVLDHLMQLKSFSNEFLPNALRRLFRDFRAPSERNAYLTLLMEKFAEKFVTENPKEGLTTDIVFILCFSLIMLSVDLCSPHVKNKMSKREFIRNTREAAQRHINDEFLGHLYDNIYLVGHVVPQGRKS